MKTDWQAKARAHAEAEFPQESCGLVLADGCYFPARNLAETPSEHFVLHPHDYAAAGDQAEIVAIVHSHPNASANASPADKVAAEATGLPWWIIGLPSGVWTSYTPCGYRAPLIGRPFFHGVLDCYALIRDWYAWERDIALPNFHRRDEWWKHGENLYLDHIAEAGFEIIGHSAPAAPAIGDMIYMQIQSDVPNHAALWLGDNIILHHLYGRLSGRDVYGGYWRTHTTHWLRHKELMND